MIIEKMSTRHRTAVIDLLKCKFVLIYKYYDVLPKKYSKDEMIYKLVDQMIERGHANVLIDNIPIGFLDMTYIGEMFYGKKGIYTAEWGHYLPVDNLKGSILLLNALYDHMLENDLKDHTISVFNNREKLVMDLFNLSYGSRCMDAHVLTQNNAYINDNIRLAVAGDMKNLVDLLERHHHHLRKPPTIIGREFSGEENTLMDWIDDEQVNLFVLLEDEQIIGIMKTVNSESGGCDSSYDELTLGIETTQLDEAYQGKGYGKQLISFVHQYAYDNNFKYIAVDYETMNTSANYFWQKHFTPTIRSMIRSIG